MTENTRRKAKLKEHVKKTTQGMMAQWADCR